MSNWTTTLDLADDWKKVSDGDISTKDFAKIIITKLNELEPFNIPEIDEEKQTLIKSFILFIESDIQTVDDFDLIFQQMYDYGDISLDGKFGGRKVMWVKTF